MSAGKTIRPTRRAARFGRQAAVLALGLAAGLAIAAITFGDDGDGGSPARLDDGRPTPTLPTPTAAPIPPGGQPAADPRSAVAAFLQAEADGDFGVSWGLLAAEDRATYVTAARWTAAHEAIAPVVGFELGPDGVDPARVPVVLHLRAGLDGVLGLVPARADSVWVASPEDGGWRVAFEHASVMPRQLDDADAPPAAAAWAESRQRCDAAPPEHGTLVGTVGLADRLCGATDVAVGAAVVPLPAADTTRFVSAYGPAAADWARVVDVDGAAPLRAVLAPIGDRWVVIGVLLPTTT